MFDSFYQNFSYNPSCIPVVTHTVIKKVKGLRFVENVRELPNYFPGQPRSDERRE
jgi:hypothetical protein